MSYKESELEDVLMNNSFYSYDKTAKPMHSQRTVQTSSMKNSPSIKALENILNEKSKSFNYNLNNLSSQSVSSFQTAQESIREEEESFTPRLLSTKDRLETIDASPLSHNDSTVNENDDKIEERTTDNEDTLIDDASNHNQNYNYNKSKYIKMPSMIPQDMKLETKRKSMLLEETFKKPMVSSTSTPNLGNGNGSYSYLSPNLPPPTVTATPPQTQTQTKPQAKPQTGSTNATQSVKQTTPKMNSFGTFENYQTPNTIKSKATPSPRKSPHFRSSSAFNLNFKGTKEEMSPGKHKRSSTLTDLSNFTDDDKKPKFSFKSLFKKKDKKEAKEKKETKDKKEIKEKKEAKEEKKKEKKNKKSKFESKEAKPNTTTPAPAASASAPSSAPVSAPVSAPAPAPTQQYTSNIMLPTDRPTKTFKSNTNINFIREVTEDLEDEQFNDDYDTNNLINHPARKVKSSNQFGEEMQLLGPSPIPADAPLTKSIPERHSSLEPRNSLAPETELTQTRPERLAPGTRHSILDPEPREAPSDYSTGLAPSALPKSNNPFVNYTGKVVYDDGDDIFGSPKNSGFNDQLLGDSLFPKSLNAQEVESIVSLERSRSMKSVKSSKRTSFVNYDGSDENIVLFNDSILSMTNSPSVSTTRSNSILKNGRNHKHNSIDSKLRARNSVVTNEEEDFNDLMEFSDFINFDTDVKSLTNLDFDIDFDKEKSMEMSNKSMEKSMEKSQEEELVLEQYQRVQAAQAAQAEAAKLQAIQAAQEAKLQAAQEAYEQAQAQAQAVQHQNQLNEDKLNETSKPKSRIQPPNYKSAAATRRQSTYQEPPQFSSPVTSKSYSPVAAKSTPKSNRMSTYNYPGTDESPIVISSSSSVDGDSEEPIQPLKISPRPDLSPEITVTQQFAAKDTTKTPILNASDKGNKALTNSSGARPISMSFKGLKAPSFGDKLAGKSLRSSGSHQSFNISYEDSDFSESAVGDGFGSSDEEAYEGGAYEDQEFDYSEEERLDYYNYTPQSGKYDDFSQGDFSHGEYSDDEDEENYIPRQTTLPRTISALTSPPVSLPKRTTVSNGVRFSSRIILYETYNGDEYDRHPDTATCNQLTPALAQMIRDELNEVKGNMPVHEASRCYTHFF